ncbi:MAG: amino acid permease [Candidatus Acidiferrales bacterium]
MAESSTASAAPKTQLLRILGLDFGLAVVLGATVGVGILRLPGTVAAQLGSFWPIVAVWIVGGIYTLLGSLSLAELSAMLPQAGGFYVYGKRAFGELVGFAVGWGDWLNNCATLAYASFAAAEFLVLLAPALPAKPRTIALALLIGFTAMHWFGLRIGSAAQKLTSSATAVTLLVLAVGCFLFRGSAAPATAAHMISATDSGPSQLHLIPVVSVFILALRSVIVTYDGWYEAIYFTEEDKNPARNLPRALIGGVLVVIALYLILNLSFLRVLGVPALAGSKLPAADAAQIIFAAGSGKFVTVLSLLTLLSLLNCVLLGAPRIIYAIGRDGLFTRRAAIVSAGGTPRAALLMSTTAALLLVALGTFEKIIAIAAVLFVAIYCVAYAAVFTLRRKEPELPRPFRAWGYPWTTAIVLGGSLLFLVGAAASDPDNTIYGVALLAVSVPAYFWKRKSRAQSAAAP